MTIRKANQKDIPAILDLINQNLDKLLPRHTEDVERLIESFFVYEEKSTIVGCSCLEVYSPKIAEIRSVAVNKNYRDKGYGTELVDAAVKEAQRQNIREIMVVTSNLNFFEKLNFTTCLNEKYALFYKTNSK